MTEILFADDRAIARAAERIRAGDLVAVPTETVYGLAANALDPTAAARIFVAKARPASNPLIVHVADVAEVSTLVAGWPPIAERLARQFWPGPLTIVLPKSPRVPDVVTAGGPSVALRLPAHPVMRRLIRAAGVPIAAPSANRSEAISPTTAAHVAAGLAGRVDLILDGGPAVRGIESTVLDLTTDPPTLWRPGPISADELTSVVGPIRQPVGGGTGVSPGRSRRHYAPRAKLELMAEGGDERAAELRSRGVRVERWRIRNDPAGVAARLYSDLHAFDAAGVEVIVADRPPDSPEWAAIRDRLSRAAADASD